MTQFETVMRWRKTSELPEDFMHRPARQFVRVEGWKTHSGSTWGRIQCGMAYIRSDEHGGNHGYRREDIERIMLEGDMDGVDAVTHWMPAVFPEIIS